MFSSTANLTGSSTYARFCRVTAVLERFVATAPRPVGVSRIARDLEMSEPDTMDVCILLQDAGLVRASGEDGNWVLAKMQGAVTLDDVWSSLSREDVDGIAEANRLTPKTELFIAQAFMELHQNIRSLLRQFQLDRISVSKSGSLKCFLPQQKNLRHEDVPLDAYEA